MTSLRDIRLWLIVALALLCLIAIRNCTIDYQNTGEGSTAATSEDGTDGDNTVAQSDSGTEDSTNAAENDESATGVSTEANQLLSEAETTNVESDTGESDTGESDTAADATGTEDESDTDGSVQANADSESDTSSSTAANGGNTGETQIIKSELVEFKLGELSNTGEFGVDLTNDISTLREGLSDYGGRIGSLKQTIEKVRSEM